MNFDIYQIAGWFGMILLVLAYFFLSTKKLKFNSLTYQSLNLFGSIGIIISTIATNSWPSVVLNVLWLGIAGFSLYKIITTKPTYKELK